MEFKIKTFNRILIYILSLFIISVGGVLSIKASLGTSPIICIPTVVSICFPSLTYGTYTIIFNFILIILQIIILRRGFEKIQYLQFVMSFIFGYFCDFSMNILGFINPGDYISQWIICILSFIVMAIGIVLEIRTELVYLAPDGFIVAIASALNKEFSKIKPFIDISMIITAALISFVVLGYLVGIREGTIVAAIVIGPLVKPFKKLLDPIINKLILN